jgi:hypothetical protein
MMTPIKVAYFFFGGILILHAFIYWELLLLLYWHGNKYIYIYACVCVVLSWRDRRAISNFRTGGIGLLLARKYKLEHDQLMRSDEGAYINYGRRNVVIETTENA